MYILLIFHTFQIHNILNTHKLFNLKKIVAQYDNFFENKKS